MRPSHLPAWLLLLSLPSVARGQAEPAPASYVPPGRSSFLPTTSGDPEAAKMWHIAVDPRLAVQLGSAGAIPRVGYGAGVAAERAFVRFGALRLGAGLSFGYHRFTHDVAVGAFGSGPEALSHMTFAARAVIDALAGRRLRPWLAVGAGLSVGTYGTPPSSTNPMGISDDSVLPLVECALGLAVAVYQGIELGLHGAFELTFSGRSLGAPPVSPYAPGLFGLGLDLGFRF